MFKNKEEAFCQGLLHGMSHDAAIDRCEWEAHYQRKRGGFGGIFYHTCIRRLKELKAFEESKHTIRSA